MLRSMFWQDVEQHCSKHELQTVNFKASRGLVSLDIGLAGPVSSTILSDSIFRYSSDIERYPAISIAFTRDPPQLKGLEKGTSLLKFKSLVSLTT